MPLDDVAYLKLLLSELPPELPLGSAGEYPFANFSPDPERLDEGLSPAVSAVFKTVFGWATQSEINANGPLQIKCRGFHVEAAADVLSLYLKHKDCAANLGPILAWVEKLTKMSLETYKAHKISVCAQACLATSH